MPYTYKDTTTFQYNAGYSIQPITSLVSNSLGYQTGYSHIISTSDDIVGVRNFPLSSHGVWYTGYNGNFSLSS